MRFCMLTSFFGSHSFGGDAVYVDRLARALLRRGHQVCVAYSNDAYRTVRNRVADAPYAPPPGLEIISLEASFPMLAPIAAHQLGRPAFLSPALHRLLQSRAFDVLHFHNISLIGGPAVLRTPAAGQPIRVMTAHEFWLVCERSVLWKFNQQTCDAPSCVSCSLRAGRPPQWWRRFRPWQNDLDSLDLLLTPSQASADLHAGRGLRRPMRVLPYFLDPESFEIPHEVSPGNYFLFAGRLVREKGVDLLIERMQRFPHVQLRIAGDGPYEGALRQRAQGLGNIQFLGRLTACDLRKQYAGAIACIVPSAMVETFGYVVIEAQALGTPVIARRLGALPEVLALSQGGVLYDTEAELEAAMQSILSHPEQRQALGVAGRDNALRLWNEDAHVERYLALLGSVKPTRQP
jgi:glycosyltransferase involved in cell wall biosynthesis